jgi:hypothetical protein
MTKENYGQEPEHHATANGVGRPEDPRQRIIDQTHEYCEDCGIEHHVGVDCEEIDQDKKR